MLEAFAQKLVLELALPVLSHGYAQLVEKLRGNEELARIARTQGIDALLDGDNVAMASLKKGNKELVTQAEKIAEQLMADEVRMRFPTHAIVGEEHGYQPGSSTRWVFDPVDGTSAMIRTAMAEAFGIALAEPKPAFGVTVAMVEGDEATLGVVAQLTPGDDGLVVSHLYVGGTAIATTCNGKAITLPHAKIFLAGSILACTVPEIMFGTAGKWSGYQALLNATERHCRIDQNCVGFMQLLDGSTDIAYEADLAYHDAAALIPILRGAGIIVTGSKGEALTFPESAIKKEFHVLAAQSPLHAIALERVMQGVPATQNSFSSHSGIAHGYASKFPSN